MTFMAKVRTGDQDYLNVANSTVRSWPRRPPKAEVGEAVHWALRLSTKHEKEKGKIRILAVGILALGSGVVARPTLVGARLSRFSLIRDI